MLSSYCVSINAFLGAKVTSSINATTGRIGIKPLLAHLHRNSLTVFAVVVIFQIGT